MDTTATSATFTGLPGHTYSFISIATSNVGISQPEPSAGQATTTVINTADADPHADADANADPHANADTHSNSDPPLVTVQSAQVETIKVGTGKKAKKETVIVVDFSGALNAASADNAGAYELAPIIKVKATGKGKNNKPATTKLGPLVPVASAVY